MNRRLVGLLANNASDKREAITKTSNASSANIVALSHALCVWLKVPRLVSILHRSNARAFVRGLHDPARSSAERNRERSSLLEIESANSE